MANKNEYVVVYIEDEGGIKTTESFFGDLLDCTQFFDDCVKEKNESAHLCQVIKSCENPPEDED